MTQQEKDLLLRDLCARLSYGVKCRLLSVKEPKTIVGLIPNFELVFIDKSTILGPTKEGYNIELIKPHLRPMSSMTEEEYDQLYIDSRVKEDSVDILDALANDMDAIDWLNKHHFDYRGLIEKGLALPAPDGMYMKNRRNNYGL